MKKVWKRIVQGRRKERNPGNNSLIERWSSTSTLSPNGLRDQSTSTFQAQGSSAVSTTEGLPNLQSAAIALSAPTIHDVEVTPLSGDPEISQLPRATTSELPLDDTPVALIIGDEFRTGQNLPVLRIAEGSELPPSILEQMANTADLHLINRDRAGREVNSAGQGLQEGQVTKLSMFENASHFHISGGNFIAVQGDMNIIRTDVVLSTVEEVLKSLPMNDFHAFHSDTLKKHIPGTGVWFIKSQVLQSWIAGHSKCKIFWVTGLPGAGKTVLAALVIAELEAVAEKTPGVSVAYAYCQYTESMSLVDLLMALVKQLLEQNSSLADLIKKAFKTHRIKNTKLTQEQLIQLLQEITAHCWPTFYVLEALDEALKNLQFLIVKSLASINVRIFITSRRLEHLEESFSKDALFQSVQAHDDDIDLLIDYRIANDPQLANLIKIHSLRDEIGVKIKKNCGGMFLHASLQMEALQQVVSPTQIRQALETFSPHTNDMYAGSVKRIETQRPGLVPLARMGLLWIAYAVGALTVEELQRALSFDHEKQRFDLDNIVAEPDLLSLFCGLVTVDEESKRVRLIHYTAHDYIKPYLEEFYEDPHAILARACITSLSDHNIPHFVPETPDDLNAALDKTPFLRYSHTQWAQHAQKSGEAFHRNEVVPFIQKCSSYPLIFKHWTGTSLQKLSPLHVAVLVNSPELLESIWGLETDAPPCGPGATLHTLPTSEGLTPLMLASVLGHVEVIPLLLAQPSVDVNAASTKHGDDTALLMASRNGRADIVRLLLATLGTRVDLRDRDGWTALTWAAYRGHKAVAQLLLDHGVDVNAHSTLNDGNATALTLALENGHTEIVRLLLATLGLEVDAWDGNGWTVLMWAAARGLEAVVQLLLNHGGTDVNAQSTPEGGGLTTLIAATKNGHTGVVRLLLAALGIEVDMRDKDGRTALMWAACDGHEDIVQLLLNHGGVDVNTQSDLEDWTALIAASKKGHVGVVRLLLTTPGIKVDARNRLGWTALMWAARKGHEAIVELLLNCGGADVNARNTLENGSPTALIAASKNGHTGVVRLLLAAVGIEADAQNRVGWTALTWAACKGHEAIVQLLLNHGNVDVNGQSTLENGSFTALIMASKNGHASVVRLLLAALGIRVDARDKDGLTALMWAACDGHKDVLKLLLNHGGSDVNARTTVDDGRWTALMWAAHTGREAIVQLLLDHGADVNAHSTIEDGRSTALTLASKNGHAGVVCLLLAAMGIEVDARDEAGWTALMWAAHKGHEDVVQLLLNHGGADVNAHSTVQDGSATVLTLASENGHAGIVRLLLAALGIEVDARDEAGWTALIWAAHGGHEDVVQLLLSHGGIDVNVQSTVDDGCLSALIVASKKGHTGVVRLLLETPGIVVDAQNCLGWTSLMLAASRGHEGVVRLLLDHGGIDVNARTPLEDESGTALIVASKNGHTGVVRLLLAALGIEVDVRDKDGWSALMWAASGGHEDVVQLLLNHNGIDVNAQGTREGTGNVTPLILASENGHAGVARLLLDAPHIQADYNDVQKALSVVRKQGQPESVYHPVARIKGSRRPRVFAK